MVYIEYNWQILLTSAQIITDLFTTVYIAKPPYTMTSIFVMLRWSYRHFLGKLFILCPIFYYDRMIYGKSDYFAC